MEIRAATASDATLIHHLMIEAYKEYEHQIPSSSALAETVQSVSDALHLNEKAFIAYNEENPVAMVRFQVSANELYFFRLSVLPEKQGKGIAKKLLYKLEDYAKEKNIPIIACQVRKAMPRNVHLYRSLNYKIINEDIISLPNNHGIEVYRMQKKLSSSDN